MAWVAVTKQGREFISMCKPIRVTDEDNNGENGKEE